MTNKTLEQIQEENRKLIILANNPEAKSYQEALEMELDFGCKVVNIQKDIIYRNEKTITYLDEGCYWFIEQYAEDQDAIKDANQYKILGKPLTLDRVLLSLPNYNLFNIITLENNCKISVFIGVNKDKDLKTDPEGEISIYKEMIWDLTKPTLEQQSEQTQTIINELLLTK